MLPDPFFPWVLRLPTAVGSAAYGRRQTRHPPPYFLRIFGCMLADFFHCELAYEAGMPEDQLFGFRGGGVCVWGEGGTMSEGTWINTNPPCWR